MASASAALGDGVRRARPSSTAALVTGLTAIALGIFQVASGGPYEDVVYGSWTDYIRDLLFLAYLVGSIVAIRAIHARGVAPRTPVRMIVAGYTLITIGVATCLALREELDWFFALAGPGLLLSSFGFVMCAVWTGRNHVLPKWLSLLLGVGGVGGVIFSEIGTSVLIGAFWLFMFGTSSNPAAGRSIRSLRWKEVSSPRR